MVVFLLPGKESTMKDSDMEKFKQQASCFGFSKEPDFVYDPKNGASSLNLPAQTGISKYMISDRSGFLICSFSPQNFVLRARASDYTNSPVLTETKKVK